VQTALADTFALPASMAANAPNLRTLLLSGDFFLGGVVAGGVHGRSFSALLSHSTFPSSYLR
jgi:hypothetical protein